MAITRLGYLVPTLKMNTKCKNEHCAHCVLFEHYLSTKLKFVTPWIPIERLQTFLFCLCEALLSLATCHVIHKLHSILSGPQNLDGSSTSHSFHFIPFI